MIHSSYIAFHILPFRQLSLILYTMADYSSMKVPELKKLLGERSLTTSGNKSDLIARLEENDKKPATSSGAYADFG